MRLGSKNSLSCLRNRLQRVVIFLWSLYWYLLSFGINDPLCDGAAFTLSLALSTMALFLWSLGGCAFVSIRAWFTQPVGISSQWEMRPVCSLIAQSFTWLWESSSLGWMLSVPSSTDFSTSSDWEAYWFTPRLVSTHADLLRFSFDGIKTSMESNPAKFVVLVTKTWPTRTLPFKAHTNSEFGPLRGSETLLLASVHLP